MKRIRLEIPLEPKCVFFKIIDEKAEAFSDVQLLKKLVTNEKTICIDAKVPDDISVIQVFNPVTDTETPIDKLYKALSLINDHNIDFKTFSVIFDDRDILISVNDGKVNYEPFIEIFESLRHKDWVIAISEVDDLIAGDLFWNFKVC